MPEFALNSPYCVSLYSRSGVPKSEQNVLNGTVSAPKRTLFLIACPYWNTCYAESTL